jgi:hypothetical protein
MIEDLPTYQSPDGRIVRAGRIKNIKAMRLELSTAPVCKQASLSSGYHLRAIPLAPPQFERLKPQVGQVLIIEGDGHPMTSDAAAFEAAYELRGQIRPPLLQGERSRGDRE